MEKIRELESWNFWVWKDLEKTLVLETWKTGKSDTVV